MSRNRDIANVFSKSTALATDTELLTAGGLVYVGGTDFSATSTVSLNNVFSSTYKTYRIIIRVKGNTDLGCFYRLRASGTDNTAANYDYQGLVASSTSVTASRTQNQTSGTFGNMGSVFWSIFAIDMTNPFETEFTSSVNSSLYSTTNIVNIQVVNIHDVATSFDGITIFPDSGYNMTGSISVYGYRKDNN